MSLPVIDYFNFLLQSLLTLIEHPYITWVLCFYISTLLVSFVFKFLRKE